MVEVKFSGCFYEHASKIEVQGKREKISRHLRDGYYVKEERNGYYLLVKPSRVMVYFETPEGTMSMNLKTQILDYFGKQKISEKTVQKFNADALAGKIKFYLDDTGYISIK